MLDALEFPLLFEPGEGWAYGVGIDWVGVAVARLNRMDTLEEYFNKYIYRPLGLSSTTFRLEKRPDIQARLISTAERQSDGSLKDNQSLARRRGGGFRWSWAVLDGARVHHRSGGPDRR